MKKIFYSLIIALALTSCSNKKIIHLSGSKIGTFYNITYTGYENKNIENKIDSIFDDINQQFSIFDSLSLISKINRNEDVDLTDDFIVVFYKSIQISQLTGGAFDITVAPLVNLWGFGNEKDQDPDISQIDSIKKNVNYQNISVNNRKLVKNNPLIQLDVNAIAKGFCVDKISQLLENNDINNYLVEIGGEIRTKGNKYGKEWQVGIQTPTKTKDGAEESLYLFSLTDKSIATSGNYRNYIEKSGKRYNHIINPKTGFPESSNLLSVSVIASDCMTADALATAFMVIGIEESEKLLEDMPHYSACFIYSENNVLKVKKTSNFP